MKTAKYIGRRILPEKLIDCKYEYSSNTYALPCYTIFLQMSNNVQNIGVYYFEILVNESNMIVKIIRYYDDFLVNREIRSFPKIVEEEAEHLLLTITEAPVNLNKVYANKSKDPTEWVEFLNDTYALESSPYYFLYPEKDDSSSGEYEYCGDQDNHIYRVIIYFNPESRVVTSFDCIYETDQNVNSFHSCPITHERNVSPADQRAFLKELPKLISCDPDKLLESKKRQEREKAKRHQAALTAEKVKNQKQAAQDDDFINDWKQRYIENPDSSVKELLDTLTKSIQQIKTNMPTVIIELLLELGVSKQRIYTDGLLNVFPEFVKKWNQHEVFIPELLIFTHNFKNAYTTLMKDSDSEIRQPPIVIGFPVGTMSQLASSTYIALNPLLTLAGFRVIDLSDNDQPTTYVEAIQMSKAKTICIAKRITTGFFHSAADAKIINAINHDVQSAFSTENIKIIYTDEIIEPKDSVNTIDCFIKVAMALRDEYFPV